MVSFRTRSRRAHASAGSGDPSPHAADRAVRDDGDDNHGDDRGRHASSPKEIPPRGWRDILLRLKAEVKDDDVGLVAAGVAFYGLLGLFPGLAALVSVYGLVADPATIEDQLARLSALPQEARDLVGEQLATLSRQPAQALGWTFAAGLLLALWSASKGARALVSAMNIAYGEREQRGFVRLTAVVLAFTLGAVLMAALALGAVAVLPAALALLGLAGAGAWLTTAITWLVLLAATVLALSLVYRYGPSRADARWRWISGGSTLATVLWLLASAGFSLFVTNVGDYGKTYGPLAAVVVLLMWLWLSAFVVLLGAELDAEMERQTSRDTTTGPERPLGQRGAYVADTVGPVP